MDVGAPVIPHPKAAKLTEPCKRPLYGPTPPGKRRHDMPRSQPTPNRRGIVAAIPKYTVRSLPRSAAFAVQRGDHIHQRQGFL